MKNSVILLLLLVLSGASYFVDAQQRTFLSEIPTTSTIELSTTELEKIGFEMPVHSPDTAIKILAEWPTIQVKKLDETRLGILLPKIPLADSEVIVAYSEESFVIDLSEPETQSFVSRAPSAFPDPTDDLAQYVANYITDTTSIHGFHIASKVAKQKSGDCTEHAVLTTTLARSHNIPSRIVLGTVIVVHTNNDSEHAEAQAFGHAWSEIWYDNQWQTVDAALYELKQEEDTALFYLPTGTLQDEGPAFNFSLVSALQLLPSKIDQVRAAN